MTPRTADALAVLDQGPRARDGRFAVRIHERDWHSERRDVLERLLAALQEIGGADVPGPWEVR